MAVVHKLVDGLEENFLTSIIKEEKEGFVYQIFFAFVDFLVVLRGGGGYLTWYWSPESLKMLVSLKRESLREISFGFKYYLIFFSSQF